MNVASVLLLLVGLFGLFLLVMGLLSLGQAGNIPFFGRTFGGWFLVIVSLFIAGGGFVGFFRMRR
ncbi:MAG TPA: hypothetical protein VHU19_14800 [Pyrinomonadaceae bacterium]|jgi:hypothetical protein|nr:hypothetical protein [Pyrinomonadaceae bacterium]